LEILTASSGREGLEILKTNDEVGVIVSDQRMPEMTGVEFLEQAKQVAPFAIRLVLTGYADVQAAMDAINRGGAYRYINKPWQDEDLILIIKEAASRFSLVKENRRLGAIIKKQNAELKKWSAELEIIVQEQTMELQKSYDQLRGVHARQETIFKETIRALAGLLELRDKSMQFHARNVAELAGTIAVKLGLSAIEKNQVEIAALLHDIGKIGIPDIILHKNSEQLGDDDRLEYEKHPVRSQAALEIVTDLREIGKIIRHHHERYDGLGFPDSLKGDDIPLLARIIAVCNFIDNTIRRFEGDSGIDYTLNKVKQERGKMFDPKLLNLLEEPVRTAYSRRLDKKEYVELELLPKDLRMGMIISKDVTSGTGLLLLTKGTPLTESTIQLLQRYYDVDPAKGGVFVIMKK
jgi:response regulator RpfG family c-di-GMP phosphodiesterase